MILQKVASVDQECVNELKRSEACRNEKNELNELNTSHVIEDPTVVPEILEDPLNVPGMLNVVEDRMLVAGSQVFFSLCVSITIILAVGFG